MILKKVYPLRGKYHIEVYFLLIFMSYGQKYDYRKSLVLLQEDLMEECSSHIQSFKSNHPSSESNNLIFNILRIIILTNPPKLRQNVKNLVVYLFFFQISIKKKIKLNCLCSKTKIELNIYFNLGILNS